MQRRPEKIGNAHAGNFARVLKSQKKTAPGALVRVQFQKVFAVHQDLASGYLVIRMASQNLCQCAFSGAVRTHKCVHFAARNAQAKTAHNLPTVDGNSQIFDSQFIHRSGTDNIRPPEEIANRVKGFASRGSKLDKEGCFTSISSHSLEDHGLYVGFSTNLKKRKKFPASPVIRGSTGAAT